MRNAIVKASVLLLGLVAAAGAARADSAAPEGAPAKGQCVSFNQAIEQLQTDASSMDKLTESQVKDLNKAFTAAYPGAHLVDADQALVFHHTEDPHNAWLVLFKGGCAVRQGYLQEKVYRQALGLPPDEPLAPEPEVGKMNAGH
ncbi:MAG: hypothetical protein WAN51_04340 [Alphaproteobacteria bacterium]